MTQYEKTRKAHLARPELPCFGSRISAQGLAQLKALAWSWPLFWPKLSQLCMITTKRNYIYRHDVGRCQKASWYSCNKSSKIVLHNSVVIVVRRDPHNHKHERKTRESSLIMISITIRADNLFQIRWITIHPIQIPGRILELKRFMNDWCMGRVGSGMGGDPSNPSPDPSSDTIHPSIC